MKSSDMSNKSTAQPLYIINSAGIVYHQSEALHIIKPTERIHGVAVMIYAAQVRR